MNIFDNSRQLVIVYLSRTGCREYTEAVINQNLSSLPILIVAELNKGWFSSRFPQLEIFTLNPEITKWKMLFGAFTYSNKIKSCLHRIKEQFDSIEVLLTAFHPWNNQFLLWCKANKVNSWLTVHDYKTHKGEQSRLIEGLQRRAMSKAWKVIFLSNYVKSQALEDSNRSQKYIVVPHPLLPVNTINNLPYNPKPSLLFLGRVLAYKGMDLLLDAVEDLEIEKLTIAGNFSITVKAHPKVSLINKELSEEEISSLLDSHEILVLPYKEASQSGVIALGTNAEMVMLITAVGGLSEQLPQEAAVWVEPNIESIKSGIQEIIKSEELYNGVKAKVKAHKQHLLKPAI